MVGSDVVGSDVVGALRLPTLQKHYVGVEVVGALR